MCFKYPLHWILKTWSYLQGRRREWDSVVLKGFSGVGFFNRVFQASKGKRGVSKERQTRTQRVSVPPRSPTPASCSPEKREKPNVVKRSRSCTVLEGWGISSFPAVVQWDVKRLPLPLSTAEGKLNYSADSILQSSGYARDAPSNLHNGCF